ncbi:MAG: 3-oxoacyl-ACP reductase FabG [candidate division NC10 bacterium]|nr:3-oxoacyl-ACP reductase FabG [candidate division NC10 bacterium]
MRLDGKIGLVTGASSGIGAATALAFANEGAAVVVNYLTNEAGAMGIVKEIQARGGKAIAIRADVGRKPEVEAMVRTIVKEFGSLHILVNNAGTLITRSTIADLDEEVWDRVIEVNLKGTFLCCQAAIPHMINNRWGRVVNIASAGARSGGGGASVHYHTAKGGILAFTKGLARELGPHGITVNAIAPGITETPFLARFSSPESTAKRVKELPIPRVGRPEEIAAAIVFLASEEAGYLTGATLDINGGLVMV